MTYAKIVGDGVLLSTSKIAGYVPAEKLPFDKVFRSAWKLVGGEVVEDLAKSKLISHTLRRAKRAELYAPHDDVIAKQIPGQHTEDAEAAREVIRTEDADLQDLINSKLKLNTLKEVLLDHNLIREDQLNERSLENGY